MRARRAPRARSSCRELFGELDARDCKSHDGDGLLDLSRLQFLSLMYKNVPERTRSGDLDMDENVKPLSDIPAINRFLSYCRIRTVPSKTVVIHAGDLPDVLYYIISGSVEVMIEDEEGNEMVLAYLNKGQFFGEMGLFYEQPTRSAWVRTRNQCELAEMTYPRFRQIAAESPGLIFELATQLATRLDRTNRKLGRPGIRGCHRARGPRHHGSVRRTGCHDAPGGHADQGQPPGAVASGGLLTRNGGPSAQGAGGPGAAARHGQDHRGLQRPAEDQDPPGHRAGHRQAAQCAPGARGRGR